MSLILLKSKIARHRELCMLPVTMIIFCVLHSWPRCRPPVEIMMFLFPTIWPGCWPSIGPHQYLSGFCFITTWTGCRPLLDHYWSLALSGCPALECYHSYYVSHWQERDTIKHNQSIVQINKVKGNKKKKLTIFEIFLCSCSSLACSQIVQSFMKMPDRCRLDMALMQLLFSSMEVDIIFEVLAFRACIMAPLSLQSLLSCLLSAYISDIFVISLSWFFWSTRIFF